MVLSVLSDLSVRVSGQVTKNSAGDQRPSVLFIVTRPEASTNKSDNTQKNHALIVLLYVTNFCTCANLNLLSMRMCQFKCIIDAYVLT